MSLWFDVHSQESPENCIKQKKLPNGKIHQMMILVFLMGFLHKPKQYQSLFFQLYKDRRKEWPEFYSKIYCLK